MKHNGVVLVAICGKGASGKDTLSAKLCQDLEKRGVPTHLVKRTTTRPQRPSEFIDPTYHFTTEGGFIAQERQNWFAECSSFRGWKYGTRYDEFYKDTVNVGTFDLKAIKRLKESDAIDELIVVYLQEPANVRLKRYKAREGRVRPEMYRRLFTDAIDYAFADLRLTGFNCLQMRPNRGTTYKSNAVMNFLEDNFII